jgi:hypothetical protein
MGVTPKIQIVGNEETIRHLAKVADQAPYAMALALNNLANAGQDAVRQHIGRTFTLRRADFVLKTIYRKPGEDFADRGSRSKGRPTILESAVRVRDDRDFLAKHEDGGVRTPERGSAIAVPAMVGRNRADIIPRSRRPSALRSNPKVRRVGDRLVETVGRGRRATQRLLYMLKASVRIKPQLEMEQTIGRVVDARWESEILAAIERVARAAGAR